MLQLIPNEVMIKQQKGFSPQTKDWEFFYIDVDQNGSKIVNRGFQDVNNRLGLNCFECHKEARPEFDLVCENDHGCAPLPLTRAMFGALQRTYPRCQPAQPVSAEDAAALARGRAAQEGCFRAKIAVDEPTPAHRADGDAPDLLIALQLATPPMGFFFALGLNSEMW